MNMLATSSRKRRGSTSTGDARGAPAPGRSSLGREYGRLLLAVGLSLLPALSGALLAMLTTEQFGWALGIVLISGAMAWALLRRLAWPVHLGRFEWIVVVIGTGLTIAVGAPMVLPWLLLPVLPAALLRSACRCGPPLRVRPVIRIFSVASMAAVLMQMIGDPPGTGYFAAVLGAAFLGLIAIERLIAPDAPAVRADVARRNHPS